METIINNNITDQYKEDVERYSLYVNRRRAIPDVKDGLKPVQRRIVWAAYKDTKCIDTNVKSARVYGDVIGKYHPHGDAGVYNAMKPLTNWFEINMPLLKGKGNWGTFQGDPQSAARYTETRLTKFCLEAVLGKIKEVPEVVDWENTYDEKSVEPVYLPVELPLLLINGAYGIGYGMSVNVPKHNINEVIDATIYHMQHPNEEITLVPDTCMECEIIEEDFDKISRLGFGKFTVRGIVDIENHGKRDSLVIRSVPDLTYLDTITDKIEELVEKKQLPQIADVKDKSKTDKKGTNNGKDIMRYVIDLKPGSDPNFVRDLLYKNTKLQDTVSVNMEVIYNYNPLRLSYREYLDIFIEFRKETLIRYYNNKLKKVNTKLHEMDAYVRFLESGRIDEIIQLIRSNRKDDTELINILVDMLHITPFQCRYIINMDLKKTSEYYLQKYKEEQINLRQLSTDYEYRITHDEALLEEIAQQLLDYKAKYGKPRNARVIPKADSVLIPKGRFKLIITENNNIKKIPAESNGIGSFRDDKPVNVIEVDNTENILIFTKEGKVHKLPIHQIPISDIRSNGTLLHMISNKIFGNISAVMYEPSLKKISSKGKFFICVVTEGGFIKRMDVSDFLTVPLSGIIYSKLEQGDYVKNVSVIGAGMDIVLYNYTNKVLRLSINDIPHLKRSTKGNMTFSNISQDNVIRGLSIIYPNNTDLIVLTENGKISRLSIAALPYTSRNTVGNKVIKLSKGDYISKVFAGNQDSILTLGTNANNYEIPVAELDFGSSMSSGTKCINKSEHVLECSIK